MIPQSINVCGLSSLTQEVVRSMKSGQNIYSSSPSDHSEPVSLSSSLDEYSTAIRRAKIVATSIKPFVSLRCSFLASCTWTFLSSMPILMADNKSLLASTWSFGGRGVSPLWTLMLESEVVSDVEDGEIVGCGPTEESEVPCFRDGIPPWPGKGGGGGGGGGAGAPGTGGGGGMFPAGDVIASPWAWGGDDAFPIRGTGGGGGATFGLLTLWPVYRLDCLRVAGEPDFPAPTSGLMTWLGGVPSGMPPFACLE